MNWPVDPNSASVIVRDCGSQDPLDSVKDTAPSEHVITLAVAVSEQSNPDEHSESSEQGGNMLLNSSILAWNFTHRSTHWPYLLQVSNPVNGLHWQAMVADDPDLSQNWPEVQSSHGSAVSA